MQSRNFLNDIHEGMKVFDSAHHEIGKVDWVQVGADNPVTPEVEGDQADEHIPRRDSLIDNIAEAFRTDELPEEIHQRLLQQGFVRIDAAGIFARDRYVLPEQILAVSADELVLNVSRDDLLKRPN